MYKLVPQFKKILADIKDKEGRKISQSDIARHLNRDRRVVNHWFTGYNTIPYPDAWALSKYLNCSMHEFYREEEE